MLPFVGPRKKMLHASGCCLHNVDMDAMEFVKHRLEDQSLNLREVADGAGVGHSWLRMFARGAIPDPSYNRIKALSDYFLRVPAKPSANDWNGQDRRDRVA